MTRFLAAFLIYILLIMGKTFGEMDVNKCKLLTMHPMRKMMVNRAARGMYS